MADASSKKFVFSIQTLNDVLTETKSIKKKLSPFLAKFQQYHMPTIYQTFDYLHMCMTKPKAQLKYKFNSLFVLKVLLDTSNFVLVNWIQALFLPHLVDIVKSNLGEQNNSKDFFLKLGYTAADDPEVEKFGFNYILLATELIQIGSMVKPFKLFESEFTQTKSDFVFALEQLKKAGLKQPEKLSMYPKPEVVEGQIAKYQQNLTEVSQSEQFAQNYSDFANEKLEEYFMKKHGSEQEKYQTSIVQIYESGDLFLSSQAIEICKAEISEPRSALTFENALTVFHRLMLSADYEAFYVLNYEEGLIKALIDVVDCDKVERGPKRGEKFCPQYGKDSPKIYTLLLDCVQKWALFAGGFVKDDKNMFKKIVAAYKETLNLELLQPSNFQAQKKRFQSYLSRNKQRSQRLAEEIQKSESSLKQVLNHISQSAHKKSTEINACKKAIVTSSKLQSSNSMNTPAGPSQKSNKQDPFVQKLKDVQSVCDKFLEDEANYDKNKAFLENFIANFEDDVAAVPDEVFDQLYEKAINLQSEVEEKLKKGQVKKSSKKQEPKPQPIKTSVKVESEVKKQVESEVSKPVTLQSQAKIVSKQVQSQTIIEGQGELSKKSVARVESVKEQKKVLIADTPVKSFDIDESEKNWDKAKGDKLGYSDKLQSSRHLTQGNIMNSQKRGAQLGYDKPAIQKQSANPKLGYEQDNAPYAQQSSKAVPSQKQVKLGYEEQNIPKVSNKSIDSSPLNNDLGYESVKKSTNEIKQNVHPSSYGYEKNPSQKQVQRQSFLGYEQHPKQVPSSKTIRKTEDLSQSRKKLEESSIKSNSKVEHFSPESSQYSQYDNRLSSSKQDNRLFENSNFKKKALQIEELEALEEFYEEPVHINKPKEFKSLTGQNRQKNRTSSQLITPEKPQTNQKPEIKQKQPSQHNISRNFGYENSPDHEQPLAFGLQQSHIPVTISPKNMPNSNFELEAPQELEQLNLALDEDYIDPPNISPLEESFHDIGELEIKIKSMINDPSAVQQNNNLSFKNCFQTDKYILQRQQNKKIKMYWLQNDTTNLVKDIITKKQKSRVTKINVPEILDERNKKYQQQLKIVEQQKNIKIKELQNKVKNLQKESEFFKQQAAHHAQQIRTLKGNSDFDRESVGQKGYLKDVQNIAVQHKLQSPQRFGYSGVKNFHFDASNLKETFYLDPKGKLINTKKYKDCFIQFMKEKEKKLMLKSKDLLHKDKDIQIGFMSKKESDRLIVTLYITPERDIESLNWNVQCDDALTVESEPHSFITYVRIKKQEKIFFTVTVNRPAFRLPRVEFTYTAGQENHRVSVVLPCAFHKFLYIKQSDSDLTEQFNRSNSIIRGQQVPYSKKVLKNMDSLRDYFQSMAILNKGQANEQGEMSYGGVAVYKQHQFPVRISVKPNQFCYVQGILSVSNEARHETAVIEYYISTVTHLLMKEIQ